MKDSSRYLGSGLLVLVALFAGWRAAAVSQLLLGPSGVGGAAQSAVVAESGAKQRKLLERVLATESFLAAMPREKQPSDPFHPRPAPTAIVEVPKDVKPPPIENPIVVLAAVDVDNPEVVLRLGGQVSGLLARGTVWNGWTIVSIAEDGIVLEGHGRQIRLDVPRTRP